MVWARTKIFSVGCRKADPVVPRSYTQEKRRRRLRRSAGNDGFCSKFVMVSPTKLVPLLSLCLATVVSARVSITGATTGFDALSGEPPSRLNINILHTQGGPAWSLYVRALAAMQAAKADDVLSYFQIMGVSRGPAARVPARRRVPPRPYWDWAENSSLPPSVGQPEIRVETPKGQQTIRNPLYSYNFPQEAVSGKYGSITGDRDRTKTVRCSSVEANARMATVNFKGLVYDAFTRSDTFAKVASVGSDSVVMSFEQPHNSVHIRAACGNNFAYPQDAAFDPLFMLHHANVDRLWAMWEDLYPSERALKPSYKSGGTYAIAPGTTISNTSPLLPFRGPREVAHSSAQVQDTVSLGYTYPETAGGVRSQDARRDAMRITVNRMYGPLPPESPPPPLRPYGSGYGDDNEEVEGASYGEDHGYAEGPPNAVEFFAHIRVNGANVPTPCEVNLYIGGQVAGSFDILTAPQSGLVEGQIPLSDLVESLGFLVAPGDDQGRDGPLSLVGQGVQVELLHPNGTAIPSSSFEGQVEVSLIDADVTLDSRPETFPHYGEARRTSVRTKPAPPRSKCGRRGYRRHRGQSPATYKICSTVGNIRRRYVASTWQWKCRLAFREIDGLSGSANK
ncbi:unnamed protein product [Parascedosporium putredinis]|uniref:tyrosinase n=1 Tax=Parascedosporium putredinis TaxID=1442378 RepID=A0A9P1HC93_9PEZI|nr:unnamed protein product [Parascedosporium putredinis]CAI8004548.1 unnamed protein product [Parascedosporium putredinis]